MLPAAPGEAQVPQAVAEAFVPHSLRGLAPEAADLTADFADDVGDAGEILVGQGQLVQGPPGAGFLYLSDPGGLFKNRAPILRLRRKDLVDPVPGP